MYEHGLGVTENRKSIDSWHKKAAAQDYQPAKQKLIALQSPSTGTAHQASAISTHFDGVGHLSGTTDAKCYHDRDVVKLRGTVSSRPLSMADRSIKTVWILSTDTPVCVVETLPWTSATPKAKVSRFQIEGSPPPADTTIELTGKLSTGNVTQYYAEQNAIEVTQGRRVPNTNAATSPNQSSLAHADVSPPPRSGPTKRSDQVQYDPNAAIYAQQMEQLVAGAESCLHDAQQALLMQGDRNKADLIATSIAWCGGGLRSFMIDQVGRPEKEVNAYLKSMSERQLDIVLKEGR